ncbi:hypothetical protein CFIO01_04652 [Colletotrichum fioriniae PJ7]|uniref:Uncharacterized protein n=1 Tax=Colletotrichum fioriniae PJ7 TaxID=1445577 RepID=A0A010QY90_9PEZI|nr:hypothetical protein CFIO01_04652 [Colletotrichum fioriniae PJ7]
MTELHLAAAFGTPDICSRILDEGVPVDIFETSRGTPLCTASTEGRVDNVKLLLQRGADINLQNARGSTPLLCAAYTGSIEVMDFLLNQGALVELKANTTTVLHVAAEDHGPSMVQLILKHIKQHHPEDMVGLLNQHDKQDRSPLHLSAQKGDLETVRALVDAGADIDIEDALARTPVYFAEQHGESEIKDFLISRGARIGVPRIETVEVELEDGRTVLVEVSDKNRKPGEQPSKLCPEEAEKMIYDVADTVFTSPIRRIRCKN